MAKDKYYLVESRDHFDCARKNDLEVVDPTLVKVGDCLKFKYGVKSYEGRVRRIAAKEEVIYEEIRQLKAEKKLRKPSFHPEEKRSSAKAQRNLMERLYKKPKCEEHKVDKGSDNQKPPNNKIDAETLMEAEIVNSDFHDDTVNEAGQLISKPDESSGGTQQIEVSSEGSDLEGVDSRVKAMSKQSDLKALQDIRKKEDTSSADEEDGTLPNSFEKPETPKPCKMTVNKRKKTSRNTKKASKKSKKKRVSSESDSSDSESSSSSDSDSNDESESSSDSNSRSSSSYSSISIIGKKQSKKAAVKKYGAVEPKKRKIEESTKNEMVKETTEENEGENKADKKQGGEKYKETQGDRKTEETPRNGKEDLSGQETEKVRSESEDEMSVISEDKEDVLKKESKRSKKSLKRRKSNQSKKSKKRSKPKKIKPNMTIYPGTNYVCQPNDPNVVRFLEKYEVYVNERDLQDARKAKTVTQFIRQMVPFVYTREALIDATLKGFPARGKGMKYYVKKNHPVPPRLHPDGLNAILDKATILEAVNKAWRPKPGERAMWQALSSKCSGYKNGD